MGIEWNSRRAQRCAALDEDGIRCKNVSRHGYTYSGDSEIYGFGSNRPEPTWVVVPLCKNHRPADEKPYNEAARRRARKARKEALADALAKRKGDQ